MAAVIFLIAVFFRFWELKSVPPGLYPDEAMNGNNALYSLKTGDFSVFYPENNGREGLFMNIQAVSLKFFGNEPWALRLISAIFGSLTILGLFYFGREFSRGLEGAKIAGLYPNEILALSASFFLAVSFWHINFSRIGFRAIMAPFFIVWGFYFLWLVFRDDFSNRLKYLAAAFGGFVFGLGAHSYIAYRVAPLLLLIPFFKILKRKNGYKQIAVFLFFAFIAFVPLGVYYLQNPGDFLGRTSQVSIFSEISPAKSFFVNSAKTLGSLWFSGDWNPRHNLPGAPLLWWPVGILFAAGLLAGTTSVGLFGYVFLVSWFVIFLIPAVFSSEGVPHALRSIITLPAIMMVAGYGFWEILRKISSWLKRQTEGFPEKSAQISRIRFELVLLFSAIIAAHIAISYANYFVRWANLTETRFAFSENYTEIGRWLNEQPDDLKKYVLVNTGGVLVSAPDDFSVKPIPMPAQTVMFLTGTWPQSERIRKNLLYIMPEDIGKIECADSCLIVPLESGGNLSPKLKSAVEGLKLNLNRGFAVFYKGVDIR